VDLDTPEWSEWVDVAPTDTLTPAEGKDWVWREDRVRTHLLEQDQAPLFVSGCAENMDAFIVIDSEPMTAISAEAIARA
jgi:hypothetical protein